MGPASFIRNGVWSFAADLAAYPFSLRELIVFLDSVKHDGADPNWHRFGFPLLCNEMNLEVDPNLEHLDTLRDFTRVSSDFYPDLALHYSKVIDDWYFVRKREIQSSTGPSRPSNSSASFLRRLGESNEQRSAPTTRSQTRDSLVRQRTTWLR